MKQRLRLIFFTAMVGAVVGAAWARFRQHAELSIPGLQLDRDLLAHRVWLWAAIALWVLLSLYWEIAARNASAANPTESRFSRAIHVVLTNVAVILVMAPLQGVGRLWPVSVPIMALGLALEACGVGLAIWSRRELGKNWSGRIAINEGHELVRSGPYRSLRHPIYTGFLLASLGAALVTGERLAVAGLLLMFLAYWRKIRLEEANLRVAFGADYDAYTRETWALIPGVF